MAKKLKNQNTVNLENPVVFAVTATNLITKETFLYVLPEKEAVIAAYAQGELRDFNTWDYERKYSHLVKESKRGYLCGDWWVKKHGFLRK